MMNHVPSRYRIVLHQPSRRWPWALALGVLWLASLALAWHWAGRYAVPALASTHQRLREAGRELAALRAEVRALSQRQTTLQRSDQISREANTDLQGTLAERDEEIAMLRADVAFYERLVGPTQDQRKGLNVFSSEFTSAGGSLWQYQIVLTQNLNRGAISQGRMRFLIEGERAGKLTTMDWNQLHQKPAMAGQDYSFRYFQSLQGQVMLPPDFTPQRVRVMLDGDDIAVEQAFDWKATAT